MGKGRGGGSRKGKERGWISLGKRRKEKGIGGGFGKGQEEKGWEWMEGERKGRKRM